MNRRKPYLISRYSSGTWCYFMGWNKCWNNLHSSDSRVVWWT